MKYSALILCIFLWSHFAYAKPAFWDRMTPAQQKAWAESQKAKMHERLKTMSVAERTALKHKLRANWARMSPQEKQRILDERKP